MISAIVGFSNHLCAQDTYRTLEVLGTRDLNGEPQEPHVESPTQSIYVLESDGRPRLSEAGYLQLADEGAGFYYGALLQDRRDWAKSLGLVGTNNWGDVEAMCFIGHVVHRWRVLHPDVRLGIDEISGRLGGFPDYNHDGISDHLTHQAGMNINLYLPCRGKPEVTIHVGAGRNEDRYDVALFGDLIDLLVDEGAFRLTTNAHLELLETGDRQKSWLEVKRAANGYSITYENVNKHARLYLLDPAGDHGDHVNVLMWKGN